MFKYLKKYNKKFKFIFLIIFFIIFKNAYAKNYKSNYYYVPSAVYKKLYYETLGNLFIAYASNYNTVTVVQGPGGTSPWEVNIENPIPAGTNNIGSVFTGIYNSTLPTLINGQLAYPELDSNGRLLVNCINCSGGTSGGTVNQGTGGTSPWEVDVENSIPAGTNNIGSVNQGTNPWVTQPQVGGSAVSSTNPFPITKALNSGSGTLGSLNAVLNVNTYDSHGVIIDISGTWSGTVSFYNNSANISGSLVTVYPLNNGVISGIGETSTSANGYYYIPLTANTEVELEMTAYTSGTASVSYQSGQTYQAGLESNSPVYTSASQQGTWNVGINAGTNTVGAVNQGAAGSTGWLMNLIDLNGAAVSKTNPMWAELTDGTNALGVSTNPLYSNSIESGTWNVGLNAGTNTVGAVNQGTGGTSPWEVNLENSVPAGTNNIGSVNQGTFPWVTSKSLVGNTFTLGSLNAENSFNTYGASGVIIGIGGTWSGSIGVYNNSPYIFENINAYPISSDGTINSSGIHEITANGQYYVSMVSSTAITLRMDSYSSGTATIYYLTGQRFQAGLSPNNPIYTVSTAPYNIFHSVNFGASTTATTVAPATSGVDWALISFSCYNSSSTSNDYITITGANFQMGMIPPPGSGFVYTPSIPIPGGVGNAWTVTAAANANYLNCTASFEELQP